MAAYDIKPKSKRKPKGKARWQTTEKQDKENARVAEIRNIAHETVMNALAPVASDVAELAGFLKTLADQVAEFAKRPSPAPSPSPAAGEKVAMMGIAGHQPVFDASLTQIVRCTCNGWTAAGGRLGRTDVDSDQLFSEHLAYLGVQPGDAKEATHYADAPLLRPLVAKCGAEFNGMMVTSNAIKVTCLKCLSALGIVPDAMPTLPLSAPVRDLANEDIVRELRATVAARDRQVTTLLKALGDRAPAVGVPRTSEALVAFARTHRPVTILEGRITACACGREFSATPEVDTSELFVRHVAGLVMEGVQA